MLSPRTEELLSYFTGLAPVGETFEVPLEWIRQDLGIYAKPCYHKYLNQLVSRGFIRRFSAGRQGSPGVIVVLRRLESVPVDDRWPVVAREWDWSPSRHKIRRRVEAIL